MSLSEKCISKIITDTISNSRTLLFVSHDIRNIAETCNKIICLNKGKLAYYGEAKEGIKFIMIIFLNCLEKHFISK